MMRLQGRFTSARRAVLCLATDDFDKMNIHMSDDLISQMHEAEYKKLVKRLSIILLSISSNY